LVPALVPGVAPAAAAAPSVPEQRPVAGEIQSRASTSKLVELSAMVVEPATKRTTDLGLGPKAAAAASSAASSSASSSGAGEVVASGAKVEEARPVRKIILDPAIPEEDDDTGKGSRWGKALFIGAAMTLALVGAWFGIAKTGRRHGAPTASAEDTGGAPKEAHSYEVQALGPTRGRDAGADAGTVIASHAVAAPAAAHVVLDERAADPKVARDLPSEFPTLLAGCRQAFTEKRAKDAESACVAATGANPGSAEACALLGHALLNRKKRREALTWAERAVALDPKEAEAYVIIGGVKQAAGDATAAKAAYKKYLELAPDGQYAADLRAIVNGP
jgi:Tetratricopeptide repeat